MKRALNAILKMANTTVTSRAFKAFWLVALMVVPSQTSATEVILDGGRVIRIKDLYVAYSLAGYYDVRFVYDTANNLYPDGDLVPPYDLVPQYSEAVEASYYITLALNANIPRPKRAGPVGTKDLFIPILFDKAGTWRAWRVFYRDIYDRWVHWDPRVPPPVYSLGGNTPYTYAVLTRSADRPPPPDPNSPVDLSGAVYKSQGDNPPLSICAMVIASGRHQYSCNPNGSFELTDLPREEDGTVRRQVYANGFLPHVDVLPDSTSENIYLKPSGSCPNYNDPYDANEYPDSAGNRIDISGQVMLGDTDTPICAMVLANGQFMFSCDGSGNYALNIPLNDKGQYQVQVYATGFAPNVQTFDEFKGFNQVRMARSSECSEN